MNFTFVNVQSIKNVKWENTLDFSIEKKSGFYLHFVIQKSRQNQIIFNKILLFYGLFNNT